MGAGLLLIWHFADGKSRVLEREGASPEASSSQSSVINYTQNEYWREALMSPRKTTPFDLAECISLLSAYSALQSSPIKNVKIG